MSRPFAFVSVAFAAAIAACGASSSGTGAEGPHGGGDADGAASPGTGAGGDADPGGGAPGSGGGGGEGGSAADGSASGAGDWLRVDGNKILLPKGQPFHGRGANIFTTRQCNACTTLKEDAVIVGEVNRRTDELVDTWHANFVRLNLEYYQSNDGYRVQWQGIQDDAAYLANIQAIVDHVASKPGAYVLVTTHIDPTLTATEWPTADTGKEWVKLVGAFKAQPRVLFGLTNEPHDDPSKDADAWKAMNDVAQTIRDAETAVGSPRHVIVVQGLHGYARSLDYYLTHPITAGGGGNIAYEVHVYNPTSDFDGIFVQASKKLPVLIGEYGPFDNPRMTLADITNMMNTAEANDVPYMAWSFHQNCPPNLIQNTAPSTDGCGVGMRLVPTADFGQLVKDRLAKPW